MLSECSETAARHVLPSLLPRCRIGKAGRRDAARSHFELACSLNPGFKIISNNLAMAIAAVSERPDDLEKALAIMDDL